ncbi:MAG: protein TolQ [Alphaproteobacteria bacterium]|jgi:biopolymer transport protein TolQ|tara:strand:- start:2967 stop:3728 length:762 start_codon:yes stop_codon:yes gene_type:complete
MDEAIMLNENLSSFEADYSLMGLFFQADIVVKTVILGLLLASIFSWAIIIEKLVVIKLVNKNAIRFYRDFWSSNINDIDATYRNPRNNPMAKIFNAGIKEWNTTFKINKNMSIDGVKSRIEKTMNVQMNIELDKLEKKLLVLASVGSTAPFIGLFGTVWGIMNSFSAIAGSKSTNLTVVAPGIAEALLATAIGLVAAIPAVMFYNKISSDISRVTSNLENFSDEFINYFSRQIDAQMVEDDSEYQTNDEDENF